MNRSRIQIILAVLLLAALCLAGIAAAEEKTYTEYNGMKCVDNCLFLRCDLSTAEGTAVAGSVSVLKDYSELIPGMMLIAVPGGMNVAEAVSYFEGQPGVIFAEPDYCCEVPVYESDEAGTLSASTPSRGSSEPDDPYYEEQWALKNMNVPDAWKYTTGSSSVIVAVIDGGVNYNHLDIIDNMWTNPGEIPDNGIDDDNNGYIDDYYGYNFGADTSDPMDKNGHGTHCAGIIGAVGNNGIGISGVAQDVSIMALNVTNKDGDIDFDGIVDAITYAVKMKARIISMSLGTFIPDSEAKNAAIASAAENDILIVSAAGNYVIDNDVYPYYTSSNESPNILSVAALDDKDEFSPYSNYGGFSVDVASPGGGHPTELCGIYSLSHSDNEGYVKMTGTSMATPMVSGLAALLLSQNPDLSAVDLKCIIMATVTPDSSLEGKVVTGGKVNAGKALENAVAGKYHIVTFHSSVKQKGEESVRETGSQVVETGACVTVPETPEKYFMQFDGWYTESGERWDFTTPVTEDLKLYAKWVEDTSLPIDTDWYYSDTTKTEYHISTAAELLGLSKIVYDAPFNPQDTSTYAFYDKRIILDNDIDLTGINWIPISVSLNNIFSGTFDGNGYTISGLSINLPKETYVGLFGTSSGRITNLHLEASTITGYDMVGTLCGAGTYLDNISVTVDRVTGNNAVGGIFGKREGTDYTGDANISVTVKKGIRATGTYLSFEDGVGGKGVGGAIGYGAGNNITVTVRGGIECDNFDKGGCYTGGAFGYADSGFRNVTVSVDSITAKNQVGGIAGYTTGDISNCSAVIGTISSYAVPGTISSYEGGAAFGCYCPEGVSGNTIKDIFVSANGNAAGGAVGFITYPDEPGTYNLTIENVLVTGNLTNDDTCGGIVGCISDSKAGASGKVLIRNCVSLPEEISTSSENSTKSGRIYGSIANEHSSVEVENCYGWEGTVDYQGDVFDSSDVKNGTDAAASDVWNNQQFFETLGWDFTDTWQMNSGNAVFKLPVLQNTQETRNLNASYLVSGYGLSLTTSIFGKEGLLTADFGKDTVQKAAEQKQTASAKSPFPVFGILAGLGIAGILVMRRH